MKLTSQYMTATIFTAPYYKSKVYIKKKKTVIMAVMHKLLNYIFAALHDQKKFELWTPKIYS